MLRVWNSQNPIFRLFCKLLMYILLWSTSLLFRSTNDSQPFNSFKISITLCQFITLHKKIKFSIKDFFSKCGQICSFLWIWSHLLQKSLMENVIFMQCIIYSKTFKKCFKSKIKWKIHSKVDVLYVN